MNYHYLQPYQMADSNEELQRALMEGVRQSLAQSSIGGSRSTSSSSTLGSTFPVAASGSRVIPSFQGTGPSYSTTFGSQVPPFPSRSTATGPQFTTGLSSNIPPYSAYQAPPSQFPTYQSLTGSQYQATQGYNQDLFQVPPQFQVPSRPSAPTTAPSRPSAPVTQQSGYDSYTAEVNAKYASILDGIEEVERQLAVIARRREELDNEERQLRSRLNELKEEQQEMDTIAAAAASPVGSPVRTTQQRSENVPSQASGYRSTAQTTQGTTRPSSPPRSTTTYSSSTQRSTPPVFTPPFASSSARSTFPQQSFTGTSTPSESGLFQAPPSGYSASGLYGASTLPSGQWSAQTQYPLSMNQQSATTGVWEEPPSFPASSARDWEDERRLREEQDRAFEEALEEQRELDRQRSTLASSFSAPTSTTTSTTFQAPPPAAAPITASLLAQQLGAPVIVGSPSPLPTGNFIIKVRLTGGTTHVVPMNGEEVTYGELRKYISQLEGSNQVYLFDQRGTPIETDPSLPVNQVLSRGTIYNTRTEL